MAISFAIVDAFVGEIEGRILRGNPAATVILDEPKNDEWLQAVAAQFNLSETAFVWRTSRDDSRILRWFTPQKEVKLCGHATLAAACFLWNNGDAPKPTLRFHTRESGVLVCEKDADSGEIAMSFPRVEAHSCAFPDQLLEILGSCSRPPAAFLRAGEDWLLQFPPQNIEKLAPDFARLGALLQNHKVRGLIVTEKAPEGSSYDFKSRFFAPSVGITEDPVTGSAHCALAPFWAREKTEVVGYQVSPRGGAVRCQVEGESVILRGVARVFARGELEESN